MQDLENQFIAAGNTSADAGPNLAALALAEAINRARAAQAERDSFSRDTRAIAISKLEGLRKKLQPLYAAIPRDVEMFDLGLVPNERPRLFVDVIAYVEMSKDQKTYRFLQETRAGRVTLAETEDSQRIVDRVTDYIAERLVERERALASDAALDRRLPPPSLEATPLPPLARDPRHVAPEPVTLTPAEPPAPVVTMVESPAAAVAPLAVRSAAPAIAAVSAAASAPAEVSTFLREKAADATEAIAKLNGQAAEALETASTRVESLPQAALADVADAASTAALASASVMASVPDAPVVVDPKKAAVASGASTASHVAAAAAERGVEAVVSTRSVSGAAASIASSTPAADAPAFAMAPAPAVAAGTVAATAAGAAMATRQTSGGLSWFWALMLMLFAGGVGAWLAYAILLGRAG